MKKIFFNFFVLISLLLIYNLTFNIDICNGQWVQTNGPYGNGDIRCLAALGNNIYGGSYGLGVFLSTNNGDSWSLTSLNNNSVLCLFTMGTSLFAGTNFGAYRTNDNCQTWTNVSNGLPIIGGTGASDVYAFTLLGTNLYAGTDDGVYVSTNNGNNWSSAGLSGKFVNALTINGTNIFAGIISSNYLDPDVYLSTNSGISWTPVGTLQSSILSLVSSGNKVFAVTNLESNNIFLTTNNGNTWNSIGLLNQYMYSLAISGNTMFAGTNNMNGNHIFRSTDYGGSWVNVSVGLWGYSRIYSILPNGGYLFAATGQDYRTDVYRSANNGDNWYLKNTGMCYKEILSLASFGNTIFAGTYVGGVYSSSNNGDYWAEVNNGLPDLPICTLVSSGNYLFAGVGYIYNSDSYGIYRTSDYGASWLASGLYHFQGYRLAVSGSNIYACGNSASSPFRLFRSTDYGDTWNHIGLDYCNIISLAAIGSSVFAGIYDSGICRTTNYGNNWTFVNNGLPLNCIVNAITVSGTNIFAGTEGYGIFVSSNNGDSWTAANNGLPSDYGSVYSFVSSGSYLFAGLAASGTSDNRNVIYMSTNYGGVWINKSQGLDTTISTTFSMVVLNNYIFAGTRIYTPADYGKSVWRRSYSEIIGIQNISTKIPSAFLLSQNYPNPFNPTTKLRFNIPCGQPTTSNVQLIIYDVLGKKIATLVNEKLQPGAYEVPFSINQFSNNQISSGIYFYRLTAGDFSETKRMIYLK